MGDFGKGLVEAAEQALAIARGEADPATYGVNNPAEDDVRAVEFERQMVIARDVMVENREALRELAKS